MSSLALQPFHPPLFLLICIFVGGRRRCRAAYKKLDTVKVLQLPNGQRNLSGMNVCGLDLAEMDLRNAGLYRSNVDKARLPHVLLSGAGTNLREASFRSDFPRAPLRLTCVLSLSCLSCPRIILRLVLVM